MTTLAKYRFELCWVLLLIAWLALTPGRPSAELAWDWGDFIEDCADVNGWCIPIGIGGHVVEVVP